MPITGNNVPIVKAKKHKLTEALQTTIIIKWYASITVFFVLFFFFVAGLLAERFARLGVWHYHLEPTENSAEGGIDSAGLSFNINKHNAFFLMI